MLYLDTSLLTALIVEEPRSARARAWANAVDDLFMTSDWGLTEVASALSIKQRTGALDETGRAVAERSLARLLDDVTDVVAVQRSDFRVAERMTSRPWPALRGADALHLAVAARYRATFHTLDEGQAAAALARGLDAVVTVERE